MNKGYIIYYPTVSDGCLIKTKLYHGPVHPENTLYVGKIRVEKKNLLANRPCQLSTNQKCKLFLLQLHKSIVLLAIVLYSNNIVSSSVLKL